MFLARKISRAKWESKRGLSVDEIPADGVTVDLKTQQNSLSFWRCPSEEQSDLENAALAIAAGRDTVDRLDMVWLPDDELEGDGLTLSNTKGRTPVPELTDLHVDVTRLDYVRLGNVARSVVAALEANRYLRIPKARVKQLLVEAVNQDRINLDDLNHKLREEVAS